MSTNFHIPAIKTDSEIHAIAALAEEIWNQHFTPIIGKSQVDYMVEKFQSYKALKHQIQMEGYE
ncbi:MAG: GNAT family N-acetyltransferase, partial [Lachnospiraceae bacterium]|nr:GNAT family N-acetyltransferase [Lachnospiraceae bacterium]